MKRIKRCAAALTAVSLLFLSGCGSYSEVDRLAIVAGGAVDFAQERYTLSCQVVLPTDENPQTELVTVSDSSPAALLTKLNETSGRAGYFSHAQLFLLTEPLCRRGLSSLLRHFFLNDEIRLSSRFAVVQNAQPNALLEASLPSESISSYGMYDMLSSPPYDLDMPFYKILSAAGERDIVLPAVSLKDGMPYISGTAVFRGDKLAGWLSIPETGILSLLLGTGKNFIYPAGDSAVEIKHTVCHIYPVLENEVPVFHLELSVTAEPQGQCDGSALVRSIRQDVTALCETLHTEFASDPLGLVRSLYQYIPAYGGEFDNALQTFAVEPEITVKLLKNSTTGGDGDEYQ